MRNNNMIPIIVNDNAIFRPDYHQEFNEAHPEHIEVGNFTEPFRINVPIVQGSMVGIRTDDKSIIEANLSTIRKKII